MARPDLLNQRRFALWLSGAAAIYLFAALWTATQDGVRDQFVVAPVVGAVINLILCTLGVLFFRFARSVGVTVPEFLQIGPLRVALLAPATGALKYGVIAALLSLWSERLGSLLATPDGLVPLAIFDVVVLPQILQRAGDAAVEVERLQDSSRQVEERIQKAQAGEAPGAARGLGEQLQGLSDEVSQLSEGLSDKLDDVVRALESMKDAVGDKLDDVERAVDALDTRIDSLDLDDENLEPDDYPEAV